MTTKDSAVAPPTIFIVDDDDAFRDSLEALCESVDLVTESYPDATSFLETFDPERPGCILLDVRMPGISGLELQVELEARGARIPIIFLTGHGDIEMAVTAMKRGARDFLTKPIRHQDLLDRVHAALRAADRDLNARMEHAELEERLGRLTPREHEVFELVVEGLPNKVISNRLDISQRTVELHRAQVMKKMEADSLADLVRTAIHLEDSVG